MSCTQEILKMETFDCKNSRPCSGLIMANETKKVEQWDKHSFTIVNSYIEYKQLYTESGNYLTSLEIKPL